MLDPPLFLTFPQSPLLFVDRFLEDGWWLFSESSIRCGYMKNTHVRVCSDCKIDSGVFFWCGAGLQ